MVVEPIKSNKSSRLDLLNRLHCLLCERAVMCLLVVGGSLARFGVAKETAADELRIGVA